MVLISQHFENHSATHLQRSLMTIDAMGLLDLYQPVWKRGDPPWKHFLEKAYRVTSLSVQCKTHNPNVIASFSILKFCHLCLELWHIWFAADYVLFQASHLTLGIIHFIDKSVHNGRLWLKLHSLHALCHVFHDTATSSNVSCCFFNASEMASAMSSVWVENFVGEYTDFLFVFILLKGIFRMCSLMFCLLKINKWASMSGAPLHTKRRLLQFLLNLLQMDPHSASKSPLVYV